MIEEESKQTKLTSTEFIIYLKMHNPDIYENFTQKLADKYNDYVRFINRQIADYSFWSSIHKFLDHFLQFMIIFGAAVLPYLLLVLPYSLIVLSMVVSAIVALCAAISTIYNFGERARQEQFTANSIAQEYRWFKSNRGIYQIQRLGIEETMDLLMDRVETIISEHHPRHYKPSKELQKSITSEDLINGYVDRAEALLQKRQPLDKSF